MRIHYQMTHAIPRETGCSHLGGCSISEVNKDRHGRTGFVFIEIDYFGQCSFDTNFPFNREMQYFHQIFLILFVYFCANI